MTHCESLLTRTAEYETQEARSNTGPHSLESNNMATNPNPEQTPNAESKAKDVKNDMADRRVFANVEEAGAYIAKCAGEFADFGNYPIAAPGLSQDESGALVFDPEIYTDDMRVMVSVLTQRGDGPGTSTVRAIVIAPVPSLEAVLANAEARQWLVDKVLDKELNHIAVRQLRKADNIDDVVESMPRTLTDYTTSNRESGGLLEAYEQLWRSIKNNMGKLSRPWKLANLSKKELRRAMESAAYAEEYYPTLEKAKQGSLFVFALNGFIQQAKKDSLEPTIFERWLEGRNEKVIDVADDEDDEFSLEDLAAAMESPSDDDAANDAETTGDDSTPEAPATDGGTEQGAPAA